MLLSIKYARSYYLVMFALALIQTIEINPINYHIIIFEKISV